MVKVAVPPTVRLAAVSEMLIGPSASCTSAYVISRGTGPPSLLTLSITKTSRQVDTGCRARPAPRAVAVTVYLSLPCLHLSKGGDDAGMINENSNPWTPFSRCNPSPLSSC